MTSARLGPLLAATVITTDLDESHHAYVERLGLIEMDAGYVSAAYAAAAGEPSLVGARQSWLGSAAQPQPWLRLIEYRDATMRDALATHGWLALEINVADVDALARKLEGSPFRVLGAPADLDVSDAIRATQVQGLSGEVLYLTQIKRAVPAFELPLTDADIDRIFIAVLSTPDRAATLAHYAALSGNDGLCFDTRLGVVNRAIGTDAESRHPVATLQLRGQSLIEIDQVAAHRPADEALAAGVFSVRFGLDGFALDATSASAYQCRDDRWIHCFRGVHGERYELA